MGNDSQVCEERYAWIDILSGIAILLMVPANFSEILAEPYSIGFSIKNNLRQKSKINPHFIYSIN